MSLIHKIETILEIPKMTLMEEVNLLLEIKARRLMNNTDAGRKFRGDHHVRTRPIDGTIVDKNRKIWMLEYRFRSYPSTEDRRHWGYILWEQPKNDVIQVFCDCRDFFFRLYYPFVIKKLASWNIPLTYQKRLKGTWNSAHTKQPARETNKFNNIYCCKHLYALLKGYKFDHTQIKEIEPEEKEKPVTPEKPIAKPAIKPLAGKRLPKPVKPIGPISSRPGIKPLAGKRLPKPVKPIGPTSSRPGIKPEPESTETEEI